VSGSIQIDSSEVDTTTAGTYAVYISVEDSSGNSAQLTRTVIVEFSYPGWTGIIPTKISVKIGSSNPLLWAWLDENNNPINTSGDVQELSIRNCSTGEIVLQMAGDPGSSGFRYKSDNYWQFNWESEGIKGQKYCAVVRSSLTGQEQGSPPIRLR
jgi:Bacterial surface protein, Ig-like domain